MADYTIEAHGFVANVLIVLDENFVGYHVIVTDHAGEEVDEIYISDNQDIDQRVDDFLAQVAKGL